MNFQLRPIFQPSYLKQTKSHSSQPLDFSVNQFSTITVGCFKGLKDTRRSKCFNNLCKRSSYHNCQYCQHIPIFSSPLRKIVTFDYQWDSDSDIFDSVSEYSYETDDEIFDSKLKPETKSSSVDIQLSNLMTEIEEITNENCKPNVLQKIVGKLKFKRV